jgi:hypothetical protein
MALISIQPLKESNTSDTRQDKGGQGVELTTLPLPCPECNEIRDSQLHETLRFFQTPAGIASLFYLY